VLLNDARYYVCHCFPVLLISCAISPLCLPTPKSYLPG
jgi:hypothetical protein